MAWYIDGPEDLSVKCFLSKYVPILEDLLQDPEASIFITDRPGCAIKVARYLKKHGYRKCWLYHLGKKPRHNLGSFPTRGGFSTLRDCRAQMLKDSDHQFQVLKIG